MKEESLMDKSLQFHNYLNAKKKCDLEEGFNWSRQDIPLPKYTPPPKVKWSVGFKNFIRSFLP